VPTKTVPTKTVPSSHHATSPPVSRHLPSAKCPLAVRKAVGAAVNAVVADEPDAHVGVYFANRDAPTCASSINAHEQFGSASVVKLLIALEVLQNNPGPQTVARVEEMLEYSDDNTASSLWASYGETGIVIQQAKKLGLTDTAPPDDPGFWGKTQISAVDVARVYQYVLTQAPDYVRTPILTGTDNAKEIARDGFDQYFGIPDGLPKASWWIKQGWMQLSIGTYLHTTGLVGAKKDSIVVLLTRFPSGTSYAPGKAAVTDGIKALAPALGEQ
jgi:hypothetical protein